jgi:hypothetical protein
MQMLGILSVVFCVALFLMCYFRERLRSPMINNLFIAANAIFFFSWNYAMFEHNGLKSGFMTLDNISPFICTIILLTPFMRKKFRDYAYAAIAFLALGMFVALFVSPEVEYLVNYHQDAKFIHVSEAACHCIMGLYGFYLVLSGKVKLSAKSYGKSLIFIYAVISYGLFLNFFFHRSYFGMNMYGDYSIYFMDLFGSFEVTLIAYIVGVFFTITVGYLACIALDRLSRPRAIVAQKTTAEETDDTVLSSNKGNKMI